MLFLKKKKKDFRASKSVAVRRDINTDASIMFHSNKLIQPWQAWGEIKPLLSSEAARDGVCVGGDGALGPESTAY